MVKVAKLCLTLLTSKEGRRGIVKVALVLLSPLLFLLLLIMPTQKSAEENNQLVIDSVFQGVITQELMFEQREHVEVLINKFNEIENEVNKMSQQIEGTLDVIYMKSVYFTLYYSDQIHQKIEVKELIELAVEKIEVEVIIADDKETSEDESAVMIETKYIPLSKEQFYKNVIQSLKTEGDVLNVDKEELIEEVYQYVLQLDTSDSQPISSMTKMIEQWMPISLERDFVGGEFGSPFEDGWEEKVSSEFGPREGIVLPDGTITDDFHTGIDLAAPHGTHILAIHDGIVVGVFNSSIGLGTHLVIDHGGGTFSIYGHNSINLVSEGQVVTKGKVIAQVGSTGYSTGPHLHLQVYEKGELINPRVILK